MQCNKCKRDIPNDAVWCPYCRASQAIRSRRPKSRGNSAGTVYKLPNGKYKAEVVLGYYKDGEKLKKRRRTKVFDKKKDALDAIPLLKASKQQQKSPTLYDLYEIYTRTKKFSRLSKSQQDKMGFAWNRMKTIQFIRISDLTIETMQQTVDKSAKTYYPARDMKVLLSHLYTTAIQRGEATQNWSQYIELPEAPKAKRQVFTEIEIAKFWDDYYGQGPSGPTEPHEFTGYILILIYTGMRVGELHRLNEESFHINERYIIGGEKTEAGRDREIPIGASVFPVVKHFYDAGVFPLKNIWKFYDDYNATLERLGIRKLPAQTCRHTYFTLMAHNKVHPALIAAMGGHAQYETAIDNYNRLPISDKIAAADKL
jgi:integrase